MIIKEITKSEFEKRFSEKSTYGYDSTGYYLEDGTILLYSEWNGEEYLSGGKRYYPVYEWDNIAYQWEIIGYEERM